MEAVELDERIVDVTQRLFSLDSKVPITVDDGRHFINTTKKQVRPDCIGFISQRNSADSDDQRGSVQNDEK